MQAREEEIRGNDRNQHEDVAPGVVAAEIAERRVRETTGNREAGASELAVTDAEPLGEVSAVLDHRGVQERVDHVRLPEESGPQREEQEDRRGEEQHAADDAVPVRDRRRRFGVGRRGSWLG